jgi:hypothetical protein
MWLQRLVEIDDESDLEPIPEPAERPATAHSCVKTKKTNVAVSTPADFQRVRLMSIIRPKEQKAKEEPQTRISSQLTYGDIEFLEHEYSNDSMPDLQRYRQLAEGKGLDLAGVDVCSEFSS